MQNGHLLIAKEKDPAAFVEFGPEGEAPAGFGAGVGARGRRRLADGPGRSRVRPARRVDAVGQARDELRGLQRPRGRARPAPLPAERQVRRPIARVGELVVGDPVAPRRRGLGASRRSTASRRAWPCTRNGRAMVALDTKRAKENLVLLEPPIAEVATP